MLSKAYFFEKMLPSIFHRWNPLPISIFKFAMLFSLIRHIYLNIIKLNLFSRKIKRRRYRLKIFNVRSSYRDGISSLYFRAFRIFSLKKELEIAKVICKPPVLVPKTAQKSSLSKIEETTRM